MTSVWKFIASTEEAPSEPMVIVRSERYNPSMFKCQKLINYKREFEMPMETALK